MSSPKIEIGRALVIVGKRWKIRNKLNGSTHDKMLLVTADKHVPSNLLMRKGK